MGFIKAFSGSLGGAFADQWKDFLTVPTGISPTVGVCPAVHSAANSNRSSNTRYSKGVITNESLILVPENFALVTLENGAITGFVDQPGGYRWVSDSEYSQSLFVSDKPFKQLITQTFDRFKYGGVPGVQQNAVYINLKEIPDNRFGTQSPVYWDDAYLNTQVGAICRGTYTLRIDNPILFLKEFVPSKYYIGELEAFDFADYGNKAAEQLFNEVVGSLAASFSLYVNDRERGNRITSIQGDALGFARALSDVVEQNYHWLGMRGLRITQAALTGIEYEAETKQLIAKIQEADALTGNRGNVNLQASFAEGLRAAGSNPGGAMGMGFMAMGAQTVAGAYQGFQQPVASEPAAEPQEDPYERLAKLKKLLDMGVITQEDFDKAKAAVLGF
jgi:membrane protease subunit (stomatin/prohibitin family)